MDRLRSCIVKGRPAYFHKWSDKRELIPPAKMIGGHQGGIVACTVGIIEYEDGVVTECYPYEIKFANRFINDTDEEILTIRTGDGETVEEFVNRTILKEDNQ